MNKKSKALEEMKQLTELSTPYRIRESLRKVLMDYLMLHDDYPMDIKDILTDFTIIFDLINALSKNE